MLNNLPQKWLNTCTLYLTRYNSCDIISYSRQLSGLCGRSFSGRFGIAVLKRLFLSLWTCYFYRKMLVIPVFWWITFCLDESYHNIEVPSTLISKGSAALFMFIMNRLYKMFKVYIVYILYKLFIMFIMYNLYIIPYLYIYCAYCIYCILLWYFYKMLKIIIIYGIEYF